MARGGAGARSRAPAPERSGAQTKRGHYTPRRAGERRASRRGGGQGGGDRGQHTANPTAGAAHRQEATPGTFIRRGRDARPRWPRGENRRGGERGEPERRDSTKCPLFVARGWATRMLAGATRPASAVTQGRSVAEPAGSRGASVASPEGCRSYYVTAGGQMASHHGTVAEFTTVILYGSQAATTIAKQLITPIITKCPVLHIYYSNVTIDILTNKCQYFSMHITFITR